MNRNANIGTNLTNTHPTSSQKNPARLRRPLATKEKYTNHQDILTEQLYLLILNNLIAYVFFVRVFSNLDLLRSLITPLLHS